MLPGVSSALAAPAAAGIPLTHRGVTTAFHVVSGHDGLDSAALVAVRDASATVVVLMGVTMLAAIADQAIALTDRHGAGFWLNRRDPMRIFADRPYLDDAIERLFGGGVSR